MADITNSFVAGVMNKDLDERLVPEGVYRDALNIDVDTDEGSNIGSARNSLGNTLMGTSIAATNGRNIGATKDEANNTIYWLVASDTFDAIFEYNEITTTTTRILKCTKATPTTASTLNLNQAYLVTAINFINGFLYWTDGFNPPRRVNIARAKSYAIDDAKIADDLQVILAPPLNPPTIRLFDDGSDANNISEKYLSFATRYKNLDGQYSALSPLSGVAFAPSTYELDYLAGNNKSMVNKYNSLDITFNTGSINITDIQLVMYDTRSSNISVIETFNKKKLALSSNVHYKYKKFNNNKTYSVLTSDQITRTFDNVPLLAESQEFVGNRLMYGNYTQFYDIVDTAKNNIKLDFSVTPSFMSVANGTPAQTWRSDRDYEVALEYLDNYGRHTTALTSITNTTYISANNSDTSNSLVVEIRNKPPYWATGYRVLIKQSKKAYYNIFPSYLYADGVYRYFLINESDRDKVIVGDYIIFKSTPSGVTHSNKKYKILELKSQPINFISTSSTSELAGLYFKIKVDDNNELGVNNGLTLYWDPGYGTNQIGSQQLFNTESSIDLPIYYGLNNSNQNFLSNSPSAGLDASDRDYRFTIKAFSSTQYKYTYEIGENFNSNIYNIVLNTPQPIYGEDPSYVLFYITWSNFPVINDKWKITTRCTIGGSGVTLGGAAVAVTNSENIFGGSNNSEGGYIILNPDLNLPSDFEILTGDIITINIVQDLLNSSAPQGPQVFYADRNYKNIEEWFIESGSHLTFVNVDNGTSMGNKSVFFRRGHDKSYYNMNGYAFNGLYIENNSGYYSTYPLYMIIKGYGQSDDAGVNNRLGGDITINRLDNKILCETVSKDNIVDIYHEATRTYRIENNLHQTTWKYQDFTSPTYAILNNIQYTNLGQLNPNGVPVSGNVPHYFEVGDTVFVKWNNSLNSPSNEYTVLWVPDAYNVVINKPWAGAGLTVPGTISYSITDVNQTNYGVAGQAILKINNAQTVNSTYNAWTFGNGLESDRIKDDFNAPELQLSPRVNAFIEDYKQKNSYNAICYSGVYGENTSVNRLNEFNLSIANFKYLDSEFGSIQKLYARDTDLLVFQENKVSKVLYGKNLIYDATGGGVVASIPEILGTQIAYPGEWGISKNPESFAEWGNQLYWTDARRGSVLRISGERGAAGDQIEVVSSLGMTDYFRDLMTDAPNSQKLGGFDPHTRKYNLSANNISVNKCNLSISRNELTVAKGTAPAFGDLFTIITDSSWSISLVSTGFGTSWLTGYATSGYGTQDIIGLVAVNNTNTVRTVIVRVTYCTSLSVDFILTQARGQKGDVIFIVKNNRRIQ